MHKPNPLAILIAATLAASATTALASGTHAGGHHDEAIGKPGLATHVDRTVAITMADDMRFSPASIKVRQDETVRFVVKNVGAIRHEFTLGSEASLKQHNELMKKFPGMEHDEPNTASVAPGATGEVVWQFTRTGVVHFACLHPGHYDAGMKGSIKVASAAGKPRPSRASGAE